MPDPAKELFHLKAFVKQVVTWRDLHDLDPASLLQIPRGQDPPDFTIRRGANLVAIEHREVFVDNPKRGRGSPMRQQQDHWNEIGKETMAQIGQTYGPIDVALFPLSHQRTGKVKETAKAVANIVTTWLDTNPTSLVATLEPTMGSAPGKTGVFDGRTGKAFDADWPQGVGSMMVYRMPATFTKSTFDAGGFGRHRQVTTANVQRYVEEKERKIEDKKLAIGQWHYDETWLLLVGDWGHPSSFVGFNHVTHCTTTTFTRVFGLALTFPLKEIPVR